MLASISIASSIILAYYTLKYYMSLTHSPSEPPLIPSNIPFVGHLIGMIRHGAGFYGKTTRKYGLPIYTLSVSRSKIYIVNSPTLIAAIDRRSKAISFAPYVVQFDKRILNPSHHAIEALREDLFEEKGPVGLHPKTVKFMHDSLAPGNHFQAITQVMLKAVTNWMGSAHTIEDWGPARATFG
ncbi:hypothetical protein F4779DRAFT_126832 [Xylariaceae sp. FL0662B]|nr:hypothetical protein F4779DRAFT_126832 [Xylariaceae sp. FL0662B]